MAMRSLKGQTAWVIGGAGLIGRGIAHGLLRAGATVIVNSRHANRLTSLAEELGHPEKLVTINGSMMAGDAERTAAEALGVTGGMLSHVVAHSGVAWWSRESRDESSTLAAKALLSLSADEFATHAAQLPALHFSALRTLLPRIHPAEGGASTYTFVTGGTDGAAGSYVAPLAQLNAHAVYGLAAAARAELIKSPLKVAELRVNLGINRPADERAADPRERPLSLDIGAIVAGVAADPEPKGVFSSSFLELTTNADVTAMRERFPVRDAAVRSTYGP